MLCFLVDLLKFFLERGLQELVPPEAPESEIDSPVSVFLVSVLVQYRPLALLNRETSCIHQKCCVRRTP